MLQVVNITEENHYEEFHVDDIKSNLVEDSSKADVENKSLSDIFKLKNQKFKDSGVDLPNILNEYESEKKTKVIINAFFNNAILNYIYIY